MLYYSVVIATEGCLLLCIREMCVRPAGGTLFGNAPWNALRMVGVGCELETETRGIDVTRRAESIGEGIRV